MNHPSGAQRHEAGQAARDRLVGGVSEDYEALFKLKASLLLTPWGPQAPGFDSGAVANPGGTQLWNAGAGGVRGDRPWPSSAAGSEAAATQREPGGRRGPGGRREPAGRGGWTAGGARGGAQLAGQPGLEEKGASGKHHVLRPINVSGQTKPQ